jgi:hypothetical protein
MLSFEKILSQHIHVNFFLVHAYNIIVAKKHSWPDMFWLSDDNSSLSYRHLGFNKGTEILPNLLDQLCTLQFSCHI